MYYLPIYVNNRRMHIVPLERDARTQTAFTFLVNAADHYDVFSFPEETVQMICDNGDNVDLAKMHCVLERAEGELPTYIIKICQGKKGARVDATLDTLFKFEGYLGDTISNGGIPFTLKALCGCERPHDYILQFSFLFVDKYNTKSLYQGAIRVCEYRNTDEVFNASLDFGSEASQVHLSTLDDSINLDIRNAFVRLVNGDINQDFWQGRTTDEMTLYKSVYHVNQEPEVTRYGDLPMSHGKRTFLQSLMPIDASRENLVLLPNLKLVEQLPGLLSHATISFSQGSFMEGEVLLSNRELSDGILRQILCNFLAVIMNEVKNRPYFHFVLLVPNVYHQEKIHKLVTGLYEDFYLLQAKEIFNRYLGIEVSVVSESDASFFGIRTLTDNQNMPYVKDACYLTIDAGKGTTDFSLIAQKGPDLTNYCSIYRSGIPASGHVLTYAFYEALRSYFYELGLGKAFDDSMRNSVNEDIPAVLAFVANLEKFKENCAGLTEDNSMNQAAWEIKDETNLNLRFLNEFLEKVLNKGKMFPGMSDALKKKVELMIGLIKKSIVKYIKNRGIECQKVLLAGRAFKLAQFREGVVDMLVNEGVVRCKQDVLYNDQFAKSACTSGAIKVYKQNTINKGSIMLGSPSVIEEFGDDMRESRNQTVFKKIIDLIRRIRGVDKWITDDVMYRFFYEGIGLKEAYNVTIALNGAQATLGFDVKGDFNIYYVGDGYLVKHLNECKRISFDGTLIGIDNAVRLQLVKESLFPYDIVSFGLDTEPQKFHYNCQISSVAEGTKADEWHNKEELSSQDGVCNSDDEDSGCSVEDKMKNENTEY